ncbi:hypothetical protein Rmet_6483 [Cupriavidus metallidurans CH34]|uniref:Uncharacterized protein n=1 Tax=Cupriavidus metallidurans (strain ATCC 43123 / DSM 2839 / NBRC 102507 / CH34) TaxID=266264 RepID=D3DXS1_CUPMC|nr:hypothetical protein Rmet_6483 [Cupriavidus metallidurans CH34]
MISGDARGAARVGQLPIGGVGTLC